MKRRANHFSALTETSAGSGIYTNENYSVWVQQVYGYPNYKTCLVITDGVTLSNTAFSVWETAPQSGVFRNFHEAIPTDLDEEDLAVPDFVPWQLKIGGITDTSLVTQVSITTLVDSTNQVTFSVVKGSLLSDKKFILIPDGTLEAPPPQGYVALRTDTLASKWWDEEQKDITAFATLASRTRAPDTKLEKSQKDRIGAVVLESLVWYNRTGISWPTSRFVKPLEAMGYTVYKNYNASAEKTLEEYIFGKQVWYSLSHGVPAFLHPAGTFLGLKFLEEGEITADIIPSGLDYRLVMVDGCCSGSTDAATIGDARVTPNVSYSVKEFADKFGPNVAYVGWAWTMYSSTAQPIMGKFFSKFQYDKRTGTAPTVEQAHIKFLDPYKNKPKSDAHLLKIYVKKDNIIDLRGKGDEP